MNPGFEKRKDAPTICATCEHVRRLSDADIEIDPMYWKCDVNRKRDLVSGVVTFKYCADINRGNCAQYEEKKP